MSGAPSAGAGLLATVRRTGTSVLALLRTRVEIFAVELQEEKLRAINLLVWLAIALSLAVAGILLVTSMLAVFLWVRFGYLGVLALALAALAGAAGILWSIRRRILHGPGPFATTVAEIGKDIACLRPDT